MPIRHELRWFYPIDWQLISRWIRFERARGRCEGCGRPHGQAITQLRDGRWWDASGGCWRDDTGAPAPWPDIVEFAGSVTRRVYLGAGFGSVAR